MVTTMPSLFKNRVTPAGARKFTGFIASVSGVVMSTSQLEGLLQADDRLAGDLVEWGVDDPEISDRMASAFAEYVLGRAWPRYGGNAELDAFLADLQAAAAAKGYHVNPGPTYIPR